MTYRFTGTAFTGAVIFEFDNNGICISYNISDAKLTDEQRTWLLSAMQYRIDEFKKILSKPSTKLVMVKINATFDMFWDRYNEKVRSSKKKSLAKWERMSQTQRDLAYDYIFAYEKSLLGTAKKYAETYLNAELWNN